MQFMYRKIHDSHFLNTLKCNIYTQYKVQVKQFYTNCYILLRFGGGVSRGLEDALDVLSILCLVGRFGPLFKLSRPESESLRSFLPFEAKKRNYVIF